MDVGGQFQSVLRCMDAVHLLCDHERCVYRPRGAPIVWFSSRCAAQQ